MAVRGASESVTDYLRHVDRDRQPLGLERSVR